MFRSNVCLLTKFWRSRKQFQLKTIGQSLRSGVIRAPRNNIFTIFICTWTPKYVGLSCDTFLRFESSSSHLESNDYIQDLYSKLRSHTAYRFLDNNVNNQEIVKGDSQLSSSEEFKEFLSIIASTDQTEHNSSNLLQIQREFCEKFHSWTAGSQLRVGYLMYLDQRINSSDYLSRVIRHLLTSFQPQDDGQTQEDCERWDWWERIEGSYDCIWER